jgi:hypothetical protein
MLHYRSLTQRFTRTPDHVTDFREPAIAYEVIGCWNCAGDGDVAQPDSFGGETRSQCYICNGTGDLDTSIEQYPYAEYMDDLAALGLLTRLTSEWNLLPPAA